jgi:hypothetical protein
VFLLVAFGWNDRVDDMRAVAAGLALLAASMLPLLR